MLNQAEHESLNALTPDETEQLVFTIQSSLQIRRRYQFYIWAQSRLHAMIPHDILVCGHFDPARRAIAYDCFSTFPVAQTLVAHLYDPLDGVMPMLVKMWNQTDRLPCTLDQAGDDSDGDRLRELLSEQCVGEFVAHGTLSPHDSGVATFFCFAQLSGELIPTHIKREQRALSARHSFMIELLMPYLHSTYQRTIVTTSVADGARADTNIAGITITDREVEILGWVRQGKSNLEIGVLLQISPLTVKNHVQKILRKLGAANRAQAVSKALDFGLILNGERSV